MKSKKNNSYRLNLFKKVKSKYILQQIFDNLTRNKFLDLIRYNKVLKTFLNIRIDAYKKEFAKIDLRFIYYTLKVNGKQETGRNSICNFKEI